MKIEIMGEKLDGQDLLWALFMIVMTTAGTLGAIWLLPS